MLLTALAILFQSDPATNQIPNQSPDPNEKALTGFSMQEENTPGSFSPQFHIALLFF